MIVREEARKMKLAAPYMAAASMEKRNGALQKIIDVLEENKDQIFAENAADVAATTEYGVTIHAAVEHDNICACQFHPEKSGDIGMQILTNFATM